MTSDNGCSGNMDGNSATCHMSGRRGWIIVFLTLAAIVLSLQAACTSINSDTKGLANGKDILFVDKNNANCHDSYSRSKAMNGETPWCSLSTALAKFKDGDTIFVFDGTYSSTGPYSITGRTFSKDTAIKAYPGEHPVLTTAIPSLETAPNTRWTFAGDADHNLWYTSYSKKSSDDFAARYFDSGISLFTYSPDFSKHKSLAELQSVSNPEGVFYDSGKKRLYIRFSDKNMDPNSISLSISDNIVFMLDKVNAKQLEISGFTIRDGNKGISIRESSNIIIRENVVEGGLQGIDVRSSHHIGVEDNEVSMSPGERWSWNDDTKMSAMETTAIWLEDDFGGLDVGGNKIRGYFNGIMAYSTSTGKFEGIKVHDNSVHDIYDDGIEIEDYCNGGEFYNNTVYDSFVAVSLSPVDAREMRCSIHHNLLVPDKKILWDHSGSVDMGECFKIIADNPLQNVDFESNTCSGRGIYTTSGNTGTQKDTDWRNNIFYSDNEVLIEKSGLATDDVKYDYNLYFRKDNGIIFKYWNDDHGTMEFSTLSSAIESSKDPGNWDRHSIQADPEFNDEPHQDLRPKKGSPACSMSTTGSYIGALPCIGQEAVVCGDDKCSSKEDCGSCSFDCGECPTAEYHWLEAEAPENISAPFRVGNDNSASNHQYISATTGQFSEGQATYVINLFHSGEYIIWGRVKAPSGDKNSFFVDVDGSGDILWELDLNSSWEWQEVNNRAVEDPAVFELSKGRHTITLKQRETGSQLDKLLVTDDASYIPSGTGSMAENIPMADPVMTGNLFANPGDDPKQILENPSQKHNGLLSIALIISSLTICIAGLGFVLYRNIH